MRTTSKAGPKEERRRSPDPIAATQAYIRSGNRGSNFSTMNMIITDSHGSLLRFRAAQDRGNPGTYEQTISNQQLS